MMMTTLLLLTTLHAPLPTPSDTSLTIFGQWQYNKKKSDTPQPYLGGPGQGVPGGFGPGGGGGGGGRPGGGSGGVGMAGPPPGGAPRAPTPAQLTAHRELVALAIRAPERLELSEQGDTVALTADSAAAIALRTNGKKVKWLTADSVKVETRAAWENGRLVVQHDVHDAGKVSYTFYLSPDGSQLFVAVRVYPKGGPTDPVPFRRVYDPAGGTHPPAAPGGS